MFAQIPNSRRSPVFPTLTGLALVCLAPVAHAQVPSYSVTGWQYEGAAAGQTGDYTLGYNFTPTQNIVISALGEWVPTGLTISGSETVGIFNSSGTLLFSSTFNQANATLTSNTLGSGSQFRYVNVSTLFPQATLTLLANTSYTVAGTFVNNGYSTQALGLTPSSNITITSGGLAATGTPFTDPTNYFGYNMYGVNFESSPAGTPTATPEPGTWAFLGTLTTCGIGLLRRRRRSA